MDIWILEDRPDRHDVFMEKFPDCIIFAEVKHLIEEFKYRPPKDDVILFLDHDLGGEVYCNSDRKDTGMEMVRYMESLDHHLPVIQVIAHTLNTTAGLEMVSRLKGIGYIADYWPFNPAKINQLEVL